MTNCDLRFEVNLRINGVEDSVVTMPKEQQDIVANNLKKIIEKFVAEWKIDWVIGQVKPIR